LNQRVIKSIYIFWNQHLFILIRFSTFLKWWLFFTFMETTYLWFFGNKFLVFFYGMHQIFVFTMENLVVLIALAIVFLRILTGKTKFGFVASASGSMILFTVIVSGTSFLNKRWGRLVLVANVFKFLHLEFLFIFFFKSFYWNWVILKLNSMLFLNQRSMIFENRNLFFFNVMNFLLQNGSRCAFFIVLFRI